MSNTHSIPSNPLIDGGLHHATAAHITHVLEFIASSEDVDRGLYLTLMMAIDAARHLAEALEPVEDAL